MRTLVVLHIFVIVRVAYNNCSEIVAICDGGCTDVFDVVRVSCGELGQGEYHFQG